MSDCNLTDGYGECYECNHYRKENNRLKQEVDELRAENKRLSKRDCNATVKLSYETKEYPFNTEELEILDIGVLDNTYIVESKLFNDLQQQLAEKDKIMCQLIKDCTNYQNTLCYYMYKDEVSENYKLTAQEIIKQAEQEVKESEVVV
jgi:cell division septum initiation protein DivIVA